ncbi:MAG TPA: hypothetical protein DCL01_04180 [Thauera sp.]|nr:hypothetical protein [Thauera sp.]
MCIRDRTRGGTQTGSGVRQAASIALRSALRGAVGRAAATASAADGLEAFDKVFEVTAGHSWSGMGAPARARRRVGRG